MKIAVAVKIVPDSQDVAVGGNGEMDASKARLVVSEYDLPAIEAAARVAKESPESKVVAVTAGPASIDDSKVKKNVLARGADELVMRADDALSGLDAFATAEVLAGVIEGLGGVDLVAGTARQTSTPSRSTSSSPSGSACPSRPRSPASPSRAARSRRRGRSRTASRRSSSACPPSSP